MTQIDYRSPRELLAGVYPYRRPQVLVSSLAFVALGGGVIWISWTFSPPPQDRGYLVFGSVMLILGALGLANWLRGYSIEMRITSDGIHYGPWHYSWLKVEMLEATSQGGEMRIAVNIKGRLVPLELQILPSLKRADYDRLVSELKAEVLPVFPHVLVVDEPRVVASSS